MISTEQMMTAWDNVHGNLSDSAAAKFVDFGNRGGLTDADVREAVESRWLGYSADLEDQMADERYDLMLDIIADLTGLDKNEVEE